MVLTDDGGTEVRNELARNQELATLAMRCRNLARTVAIGEMRDELIKMAFEYDAERAALSGSPTHPQHCLSSASFYPRR